MLSDLVLQKLLDEECLHLLQAWYLDDGVLAGRWSAVLHALNLIEKLGPHMGLFINCDVFSPQGNNLFPPAVKSSILSNLSILGVPIGDYLHFPPLEVSAVDLHIAASHMWQLL